MAPRKKGSKLAVKASDTVPGSDHIVFAKDGAKEKKANAVPEPDAPPKPDARKIIGGSSWSGKLPMTLLSEHCQKQKWNKPDYSLRKMPEASGGNFRSGVKLSKTDPKTRETTTIPAFHLPDSHAHLADQPTALEARHFAATYALFRISSMKNVHMMLPPHYRDLWKGDFDQLKATDVADNKAWKYDADPFAADAKRHEIQADIEKRKVDKLKADAAPPVASLALPDRSRAWARAAKIEMGQEIRRDIEELIRERAVWNPYDVLLSNSKRAAIVTDLVHLGFRASHVREAIHYCKDREEVLEWLLVYVPEDDLPQWCLPAGYSAGVSLASGNLEKEAKLKRLTEAGFSLDLCTTYLEKNQDNEALAAESLQQTLVPSDLPTEISLPAGDDIWQEEMATLEAIFGDRFSLRSHLSCSVNLELESATAAMVLFRKPTSGYPTSAVPVISIHSKKFPAYIRLSATKQAIMFARRSLLGDSMIFGLVEFLETNMVDIAEKPGSLMDLIRANSTRSRSGKAQPVTNDQFKTQPRRRDVRYKHTLQTADEDLRQAWNTRQMTPAHQKMLRSRQTLPAWSKQDAIVEAVQNNQCVIISGETGSGKSTQSVQFVLDHLLSSLRGSTAKIVCTQPRRISALGLSDRVSAERCSQEGQEVGYIIRGDSKVSADTKITFMTTGVLLRRLQSSPNFDTALADLSHIFVDEVHERSLDTDFLLALIREALKVRKDLKLILMSATLDSNLFLDYFGGATKVGRVHIEGRTFPVSDFYLDDIMRFTKANQSSITAPDPEDEDGSSFDTGKAIMGLGAGINYGLIADLVGHIDSELGAAVGGILIFLPGTLEIDRCLGALRRYANVHALPLHASLTPVEQKRVFPPAPNGKRKVIACTNVAETSITIEDIVAVIDTGRAKETRYDPSDNIVRLEEVWASQAACKQRRGRAGRVREGYCYKLYTRNVEASTPLRPEPEIRRVPLEQLCLSVMATGSERDPASFLAQTLTPPESGAVTIAMKLLHTIGALDSNHLTALGTYLTMIPADLRCAKLLIYGSMFSCLESCLTIASILTIKSPFVSPRDKREEAKEARSSFPTLHGDLLLDLTAYNEWEEQSQRLRYRDLQDWCSSNFLAQNTLKDIRSTRSQLLDALIDAAIAPSDYSRNKASLNGNNESHSLLRALIASALNPQIARIDFPDKKYIASMSGAKELDPEARAIKFFNQENGRVFVHPSSVLFDAQTFPGSAAFISYFTKMATSKTFVRDLTPLNAYTLLLFGGPIELDTSGMGLTVDGWFRLRGWARIGVLVSRLRSLLDDALRKRIDNPSMPLEDDKVFGVVRRLLELNGQDR